MNYILHYQDNLYLLLTELPTMLTVLNINYQLQFSECYSGSLHAATSNENIPYVMPLDCALQSLVQESYVSFSVNDRI